jgi:hypothetical protein
MDVGAGASSGGASSVGAGQWTTMECGRNCVEISTTAALQALLAALVSRVSDTVDAAYGWLGAAVVLTVIPSSVSFAVEGAAYRRLGAVPMPINSACHPRVPLC